MEFELPTARQRACVEIGGIPISLATANSVFFDLLIQRYANFISAGPGEFELEFEIVETGSARDEDVEVRWRGSEWEITRGDFAAHWNPRSGQGIVRQNANPYSLDSVLRILHSLILAERGGFLLHSASGIVDSKACLFSGVSGAGKTTITRLAPPDVVLLTDEVSYIQPGRNGYLAFGTPFAGELARPGENTNAPIAALFFLDKGPCNLIEPVPSSAAVQRLLRNILFFAADRRLSEKLLATACDFISRVPVRKLTFRPDAQVWNDVRNFVRSGDHASLGPKEIEGVPSHA
jgi:hypothetical protein